MSYCNKCGQAEYHAPGQCPYDEEIPTRYAQQEKNESSAKCQESTDTKTNVKNENPV